MRRLGGVTIRKMHVQCGRLLSRKVGQKLAEQSVTPTTLVLKLVTTQVVSTFEQRAI